MLDTPVHKKTSRDKSYTIALSDPISDLDIGVIGIDVEGNALHW